MKKTVRHFPALALLAFAVAFGVRGNHWSPVAASPSPEGTELPPATQIVDAVGAVWTLASDFRVLRNGVHAASGYGRLINYSQQTIYVYSDSQWWRWTGSGWTPYTSTTLSESPDGTELPPATQIVDATGAVWTLATDFRVLRNGVHAASGYGTLLNYSQQTVYVWGGDSRWWRWTGTGWTLYTPLAQSASGTAVPPASQIVDDGGNVWTLAPDRRVLRNGVHAGGGYSTSMLWLNQTVYVLGLDGIWWYQWNDTGWVLVPNQPPAVSLTAPANGATFTAPATITVSATASDDGAVTAVDFYAGATWIGSDMTAPYSVSWNNVGAGLYALTAVARDNAGGMTVSAARDIRVDPGALPRTAVFTASANHATAVDRYFLEIYPAGADPWVANPVATRDLGKPPVVGGECTVDVSGTTSVLPPGSYIATVTAIGGAGSARSAASPAFVR